MVIFHKPDFLVPPQALGALRAVRNVRVRVRSYGAASDLERWELVLVS